MADAKRPFGERFAGVARRVMPLTDVDQAFRVAVWNIFDTNTSDRSDDFGRSKPPVIKLERLLDRLAFRKNWAVDGLPSQEHTRKGLLKKWLLELAKWHEVYELIEDAPALAGMREGFTKGWPDMWNPQLERLGSPYRFVGDVIAPITSEEEQASIERALTHQAPYDAAAEHISTAVEYFGKRPTPDYDNSIKEAASGLESAICVATGVAPGNFTAACSKFREKYSVHPALLESAKKLFGYANDEQGIRHAATETESAVDFAEAHLVLVQASSWVNYVVQIAPKA